MEAITVRRKLSPVFTCVAEGSSYATVVARLVVNHHTQLSELWITPVRYSDSTQRHIRKYTDGFVRQFSRNHANSGIDPHDQIFQTNDGLRWSGSDRCGTTDAMRAYQGAVETMHSVDAPRLRAATRMGAIEGAKFRVDYALRRLTHGVPEGYAYQGVLDQLLDLQAFITSLRTVYHEVTAASGADAAVAQVRAAVRGWRALTEERRPTPELAA